MKDFGKRLKELRLKAGLSQQQLAKIFNVSDISIILYEHSKHVFTITKLIEIAKYFNVTVDYIVGL